MNEVVSEKQRRWTRRRYTVVFSFLRDIPLFSSFHDTNKKEKMDVFKHVALDLHYTSRTRQQKQQTQANNHNWREIITFAFTALHVRTQGRQTQLVNSLFNEPWSLARSSTPTLYEQVSKMWKLVGNTMSEKNKKFRFEERCKKSVAR